MSYDTELGGTTLPPPAAGPEGCSVEEADIAAYLEMADGSLVYDYTNTRRRWALYWAGITHADLGTIATQAHNRTAQQFSPPYNSSDYTVFVIPSSLTYDAFEIGDGNTYYNANLQVEETA